MNYDMLSDKEKIERLERSLKRIKQTLDSDRHFYNIALNLSGRRDELEESAHELINLHGESRAGTISRKILS